LLSRWQLIVEDALSKHAEVTTQSDKRPSSRRIFLYFPLAICSMDGDIPRQLIRAIHQSSRTWVSFPGLSRFNPGVPEMNLST
jgi:hypothetical protein